jgi:hypothetical protein
VMSTVGLAFTIGPPMCGTGVAIGQTCASPIRAAGSPMTIEVTR